MGKVHKTTFWKKKGKFGGAGLVGWGGFKLESHTPTNVVKWREPFGGCLWGGVGGGWVVRPSCKKRNSVLGTRIRGGENGSAAQVAGKAGRMLCWGKETAGGKSKQNWELEGRGTGCRRGGKKKKSLGEE